MLCLPLLVLKPADQVARIKVTNHSGVDMVSMVVTDPGAGGRPGTDVLAGPSSLRTGVQASFEHLGYSCARTIDVEFADGHREQRTAASACSGVVVEFASRQGGGTENPSFMLGNSGAAPMTGFHASKHSASEWGQDRLGAPLPQGQSRAIYLPRGECFYDLRATFSDGQTVERRNIDVCSTSALQIP